MKGQVFLDIGSNNGYYTPLASDLVGKTGKVISVEPDKSAFSRLLNNIRANKLENVFAFNFALSDFTGTANLYLDNETEDGQGSLMDSIEKINVEEVEVKNFNEVLWEEKIDMINMEVDGSKISLLKSFKN